MDFNFRLSELFPNEISVVEKDLIPKDSPGLKTFGDKVVRERLTEILDKIGEASAKAQQLHTIITTASRLRESVGGQAIYFLCDFGRNQVVGILRIGKKKLFLYDQQGVLHELNPLCVLDFYVSESRQRKGYGKALFDAMLQNENIDIRHMAYDRPSDKFVFFLRKNFGLNNIIPQVNNFAIYDGFFNQRTDYAGKKAKWAGLDQTPEKAPRHETPFKTEFQDSRSYNTDVPIHFRNLHTGPNNDYTPQSQGSSIGQSVNGVSTNGHHNGGTEQTNGFHTNGMIPMNHESFY